MARGSKDDRTKIIAEFLSEKRKEAIVQPNEFLMVVRDGVFTADGSLNAAADMEIIHTEGKHALQEKGKAGSKQKVRALLGNGSPHSIEFRTLSSDEIESQTGTDREAPVLSKDGMPIPMRLTLNLAVDEDNAWKLFRLTTLRTAEKFTTDDLQKMLQADMIANVIGPVIESYDAGEIRGNDNPRNDLLSRLSTAFEPYVNWYGIRLTGNKLAVEWDLTDADKFRIKATQKQYEETLNPPKTEEPPAPPPSAAEPSERRGRGSRSAGRDINDAKGLSGGWIVLLVLVIVVGIFGMFLISNQ
jgi:hypothetical protein